MGVVPEGALSLSQFQRGLFMVGLWWGWEKPCAALCRAPAGGDKRGKQSAALRIHRGEGDFWIDIRAEAHTDPLAEPERRRNGRADAVGRPGGGLHVRALDLESLEASPGAKSIVNSADPEVLKTGIFMDALYMNKAFIAEHRDTALAVLKARWEGLGYWSANVEETNTLMADFCNGRKKISAM